MSTLGGITCTFIHAPGGSPPAARRAESQVWRVPGLDGFGIALLGLGDSEFELVAVLASNNAGVDVWAALLQAKQATIVTIVDDFGNTFNGCFLESVGNVRKTAARVPGGSITVRGEIQIRGRRVL